MRIETNIPIYRAAWELVLETLRTMKYGDSVVADSEKKRDQIYSIARSHGMKVRCHKISHGVWRIWKVEKESYMEFKRILPRKGK